MPSPRRSRLWIYLLFSLPVLFVLAAVLGTAWVRAYLRSDDFRRLLGAKVSQGIRADGEFGKMDWTGSTFYTQGFEARGWEGTKFQSVDAQQVRAVVNWKGLRERQWRVDSVEVERLRLVAGEGRVARTRIDSPQPAGPPRKSSSNPLSRWLPKEVRLGQVKVADLGIDAPDLAWPVRVEGVTVEAAPDGKAWKVATSGGSFQHLDWPKINLGETRLRYTDGLLFITDAALTSSRGGTLKLTGSTSFNDPHVLDVDADFDALPLENVLPEDWRAKLIGKLSGKVKATRPGQSLRVAGRMEIQEGRLQALPVLDQIALFTRTQRFRQLALENCHGDIVHEGGKLTVTNFNAESPGLVRLNGNFVIENNQIDGTFLVGVTPASLRYIPGSQDKIFTLEKEGYRWTTMRVQGPLDAPREDLSSRLAVAAGQELIEQIQENPSKVKDVIKDAAQSLLDMLGN